MEGTLMIKLNRDVAHFNIFSKMKNSINSHFVCAIYATNSAVQEFSEFDCRGQLKVTANKYHELKATYDVKMSTTLKKMTTFNGDLDPVGMPKFARKFELRPD